MYTKIFLALTALSAVTAAPFQPRATARVASRVQQAAEAAQDGDIISIAVQLKNTLEVAVPESLSGDRLAAGQFVYQRLDEHAKESQKSVDEVLKSLGDEVKYSKSYIVSNSLIVDGTKKVYEALASHPDVASITSNTLFEVNIPKPAASLDDEQPAQEVQWNLKQVYADKVWDMGFTGGNLTVAAADTGFQFDHPEIVGNYLGNKGDGTFDHNYAWFDGIRRAVDPAKPNKVCPPLSPAPCDDDGHGTHVISTAAGRATGVAPGTKWMSCRNMDQGYGRPETYLNCLEFFLAPTDLEGKNPDPAKRPVSVGNSYGCPEDELCDKKTLDVAMKNLRAAGVFMAVSAGNYFREQQCESVAYTPARSPDSHNVAAVDKNFAIASFSSRGPVEGRADNRGVDISAPGVAIRAGYPGSTYTSMSGTSMASPHVNGAIPLIVQACPKLARNVDAIAQLLYSTADPLATTEANNDKIGCNDTPGKVPNQVFGYGHLNILKAIEKCRAEEPSTPTPNPEEPTPQPPKCVA
ncbi:peptidase S8/S53 domain-containing protein [Gaertneriomyces semiglobifer]|nr:peptidase S8/S53 domain-containing protein [Gaertneriomyces semiglobifer]